VQHVRGKHAEELASDEHALAIMEAAHGATQDDVADAAMTAASALLEARRYDEAERQLRRALPIYEKIYGAKDQNVANVLVGLVASSLAQHRIAEALAEAERALTIVQSAQMAPGQAGDVYLALAKTRWATGSHAAALSAAAQAAAAYQEAGKDFTSNREELATWQSTHH
jgi:tetratricopeptide (TPR) repeat protein